MACLFQTCMNVSWLSGISAGSVQLFCSRPCYTPMLACFNGLFVPYRKRAWKSARAPMANLVFGSYSVTLLKLGNFRHPPCAGSTCKYYLSIYLFACLLYVPMYFVYLCAYVLCVSLFVWSDLVWSGLVYLIICLSVYLSII